MENLKQMNEDLKQKIEEMLRKAYRKNGYRYGGEIELNIRGMFLDGWTAKKKNVVVDGEMFENALMLLIATDFGTKERVYKNHKTEYSGTIRIAFDYSHQQNLYVMVDSNENLRYVLRDYDFYHDWFYLENTHSENAVFKTINLDAINLDKFKPIDYYINAPKLDNKTTEILKSKMKQLLSYLDSKSMDVFEEYFQRCVDNMEFDHLTSVEIGAKFKHVYVLPIANYIDFHTESQFNCGRITRYGKTYSYDQSKSLAFLIEDDAVELAELYDTTFNELKDNIVVSDTFECCNGRVKILNDLCDVNTEKCWTYLSDFKAKKERELEDKARRARMEAEKEMRRAELRARMEAIINKK